MESKFNRISIFIENVKNLNELTDEQQSMVIGGKNNTDDQDGDAGANNCAGGNCYIGCGTMNGYCPNNVTGCGGK